MQQLFDLIEFTGRSVFLTGRAGTGKTTFLKDFVKRTSKKLAIVAPTGIAAINAGGVTIHSMFGLPLTTFVPTTDFVDRNEAINIPHLLPHFKYRKDKLKLFRTLEILIIDEVSMLRADVLDMMDLSLRSSRKNNQPFGGLQILFIGDLYQLPPVVKGESEAVLYRHYASPFFFEAKALQNLGLLTVSLTKVYRQTDPVFLQMLNSIRDNDVESIDFDLLHSRYQPQFEPDDFYVHLVSHNYLADAINRQQLDALSGKAQKYKARVEGEFKPHLYPNDEQLQLKEGAQVMFIRNDTDEGKRFYNGRLATVVELFNDKVKVLPQDGSEALTIGREKWENKKYYIDEQNKIGEDIIGSYEQFPFKLAWAVTIHKSQGLTFDKVIIDAGKSFTSGQVYVALSRCRTLGGIVLKSKIPPQAIITDPRILRFQEDTDAGNRLAAIINAEQYNFEASRLIRKLNIKPLLDEAQEWKEAILESAVLKTVETEAIASAIALVLQETDAVFEKFSVYLHQRLAGEKDPGIDLKGIEEKCRGAVNFFYKQIHEKAFTPAMECYAETKGARGLKGYNGVLKTFVELMAAYLSSLKEVRFLGVALFDGEQAPVKTQTSKKPSHIISYQLFEAGQGVKEIAAQRNLTEDTILTHLAKMAAAGVLDINRLFPGEQIKLFEDRFRQHRFKTLTEWKNVLPESFSFNEIRVLLNHFNYYASKDKASV